ncbi:MAG TPA: class I SAM-dependent methyltransferase, partial [Polyangiaceae bacterium]
VGCGAGRWCLELQARKIPVVGIDASPLAIEVCERRGVRDARVLTFALAGKLARGGFESIVMMGNNLALLGSLQRGRRLLAMLDRITTSTACIYGQTIDPYQTIEPIHFGYAKPATAVPYPCRRAAGAVLTAATSQWVSEYVQTAASATIAACSTTAQ